MSLIRRHVLESVQRVLIAAMVVVVLTILSLAAHALWKWNRAQEGVGTPTATQVAGNTPAPTATAPNLVMPTPTGEPEGTPINPNRIGIVAGHWQSDSGAVCEDGLQEVTINLDVATRVVTLLERAGYEAEILAEFSPKLSGYVGAAVVSIHTDSCAVPEASGFLVARVSASEVPELEDRLVQCLIDEYARATGLAFHQNSITFDMTEYHAFYEIAPETPAAIIEIGFMAADRSLLTKRQDRVAKGIANGIQCFVSGAP